jgi:hypothetical protein
MMNKHKRTRDGRWIDDVVVDEGAEVRVPAMLCDAKPVRWVRPLTDSEAALHRAGFRTADRATRDSVAQARDEMIDRQREAWRGDRTSQSGKLYDARRRPDPDEDDDDDDPDVQDARRFASREAWVRGLQDAWRSPAPSLPAPSPNLAHGHSARAAVSCGPGPAATLPPSEADDPQAKRDQAWQEYSAAISNA